MESHVLYEVLIRGACSGLMILAGLVLFGSDKKFHTRWLLGIFLITASAYPLVSSPFIWNALGFEKYWIRVLANLAIVPLWLSICRLFDDEFRWEFWRFLPLLILVGVIATRASNEATWGPYANVVQHSVTLILMGYLIWLILSHKDGDLVQSRRDIRLGFALSLIGLAILIALGELTNVLSHSMPSWAALLHGMILLCVVSYFFLWLTHANKLFEHRPRNDKPKLESPEDSVYLKRLQSAMAQGMYKEEGLKVGVLAGRINMSEHRLRNLINYGLGFNNFPSYLNELRLNDAKADLSDPDKAHLQILHIALNVGYGSIGPFNRAFKLDTGLTPSGYRKKFLLKSSKIS